MALEVETLHWSIPSPVANADPSVDGWVWMGNEQADDDDLQTLRDWQKDQSITWDECDELSLPGLYDREWSSNFYENNSGDNAPGGEGSHTYETQKLGEGVCMTKDRIYHYPADGSAYIRAVPATYSYHWVDMGGGYKDAHELPEPGSEAEKLLGDGSYKWANFKALWKIV